MSGNGSSQPIFPVISCTDRPSISFLSDDYNDKSMRAVFIFVNVITLEARGRVVFFQGMQMYSGCVFFTCSISLVAMEYNQRKSFKKVSKCYALHLEYQTDGRAGMLQGPCDNKALPFWWLIKTTHIWTVLMAPHLAAPSRASVTDTGGDLSGWMIVRLHLGSRQERLKIG